MLVQSFRDVIPKAKQLGHRVVEQFDDIIAQFSGLWNVQHKDDGSHGDITADSIVVSGDLTVGGDIIGGDGTSAVLDNLQLRGQDGNNFGHVRFSVEPDDASVQLNRTEISTIGMLESTTNLVPNASITFSLGVATRVWTAIWSLVAKIGGVGGTATLSYDIVNGGLSVDDDLLPDTTDARDLGAPGGAAKRWRNLYLSSAVFEAARTVAMGYWQAVAFSAGNFVGNGSMTWTVASGDVIHNRYTLIGKTMVWSVALASTTVGGTPNTELRITVPGGFTVSGSNAAVAPLAVVTDNGTQSVGFAQAVAGQTYVKLSLNLGGTNWTASTDNTAIFFTITLEIE
jgi:hypothetical protein